MPLNTNLDAAKGFLSLGMLDEALTQLEELPSRHKDDSAVSCLNIEIHLRKESHEIAFTLLDEFRNKYGENEMWHLFKARLHAKRGEKEIAKDHVRLVSEMTAECYNQIIECQELKSIWQP
ncbi:MAG: hypothetical protein AAGA18_09305 [Verrucomicrobiota bacterium]